MASTGEAPPAEERSAEPSRPKEILINFGHLAALSRELAANDWQERTGHSATVDGRRGDVADRNVELIVRAPFTLPAAQRPKPPKKHKH